MIIFVGSNPSIKSDTDEAFSELTVSGRVLKSWIDKAEVKEYTYVNVSDTKTEGNRPLKVSEIRDALPALKEKLSKADKVVALGQTASKAMMMSGVPFLEMPHPSGLNRKLNDPKYVEEQVGNLRTYAVNSSK